MEIIKHSSIDLNWISRKNKQTTLPKLVYIESHSEYGGFYVRPDYYPFVYEGKEIPSDKGILFVVDDCTTKATIAHEWRHHWQTLNGWKLEYDNFNYVFSDSDIYKKEIIRYFKENIHEMDALIFENKYAKDYLNEERIEWLRETSVSN